MSYYSDLLPFQYRTSDRFCALIEAFTNSSSLKDIESLILRANDIDAMTSHELDWFGKIIGQSRELANSFMQQLFQLDITPLDEFPLDDADAIINTFRMSDEMYRSVLKLRLVSNGTFKECVEWVSIVFKGEVALVEVNPMIVSLVTPNTEPYFQQMLRTYVDNKLIPKPLGSSIEGITTPPVVFFQWDVTPFNANPFANFITP